MTFDISPIAKDRMDLMARHIRRMPPLAIEGESRVWAVFHPPSVFHADEDPENPNETYWEQDWFFEEHSFLALQMIHQGRCYIKTLLESYPAGYPQHRVLSHVADALEMLNESPPDCSRYELRTLKQQAEFTARKALAGAHTVSEENVQQFFEDLLELELPEHIMISALSIGAGNDPILEHVLRNRIQFPQATAPELTRQGIVDAIGVKFPPSHLGHLATVLGCSARNLKMPPGPTITATELNAVVAASRSAGLPEHLAQAVRRVLETSCLEREAI